MERETVNKFISFPLVQMLFILYVVITALLYSPTICTYLIAFVFFNYIRLDTSAICHYVNFLSSFGNVLQKPNLFYSIS